MDRIALDLGFLQIYWYSIFIFLGILVGVTLILKEAKKHNINEDFMVNLIFYTVIFGLVGARLYYVAFNLDYYLQYPFEILEVWNGGLAIHGGILFGLLWILIYCKKYKVRTSKVLDISVVGLIIGQAIGRWGNFFNQEAYGAITTLESLQELGMPQFIIDGMFIQGAYRQPAFFYESIWCLFGFFALLMIRRSYKYLKTGQLTGFYLIWYSVGRFFIEYMRTDSLMLGELKMAQVVSIACIILGILLILFAKRGTKFDHLYSEKEKEEITF
ncbi:MAG: prolipoprotein diacylglyceryl transferase [Firmicutes bacterium]|nr:prolipoprotein diacylglyceryl transferase [Bacillota bacterium]